MRYGALFGRLREARNFARSYHQQDYEVNYEGRNTAKRHEGKYDQFFTLSFYIYHQYLA